MRVLHCLTIAAVLSLHAAPAAAADRPNVVLFLADDLSWPDCPPAGGSAQPTPNMARLTKDGITFTRVFVASPSCAPNGSALPRAPEVPDWPSRQAESS